MIDSDEFQRINGLRNLYLLRNRGLYNKQSKYVAVDGVSFSDYAWEFVLGDTFGMGNYNFGGLSDCIFVDVGMNIGDSTLWAASQKHVAKVYGFEPFSEIFEAARRNIALNPAFARKIEIHKSAWGGGIQDRPGHVLL